MEDREDYNVDKELKETTNIIEKNDVIVAKRNDTMVETVDKDEGNRMVVNLNWRDNSINFSYNQSNSISPKIPIETSPNHFTNSKTTGKANTLIFNVYSGKKRSIIKGFLEERN